MTMTPPDIKTTDLLFQPPLLSVSLLSVSLLPVSPSVICLPPFHFIALEIAGGFLDICPESLHLPSATSREEAPAYTVPIHGTNHG
jgi:hypothetical protein